MVKALLRNSVLFALVVPGLMACEPSETSGLHPAVVEGQAEGPVVIFEPLRLPDPEVPFPSDLAIRTGANGASALNVSVDAPTRYERRFRAHLNEIPGFSGMTPITLSFDRQLDLTTVRDDTVYVVNIEPGSERFGERIPLDLGRGWFPPTIGPTQYFPNDPFKDHDNMVLPPDNVADLDGDGVAESYVYHYENETHTLDLRPLVPMESGAQYAVVLTRDVMGFNSDGTRGPIRSPFEGINHDAHTKDLKRAIPSLAEVGVALEDIAFGWTLTTGDLAETYRALREGLYGRGALSKLNDLVPPDIVSVYDTEIEHDGDDSHPNANYQYPFDEKDHRFILQGPFLDGLLILIQQWQPGVSVNFDNVDYIVFGEMLTPDLRATEDQVWELDLAEGKVTAGTERVPWMMTVPKSTANHQAPFPVVIHAHATGTSRIEVLLLADKLARAGMATLCIDAVGHGPILTDPKKLLLEAFGEGGGESAEGLVMALLETLVAPLLWTQPDEHLPAEATLDEALDVMLDHGFMAQLAREGRAVDDNGDCEIVGGEAYYTPDPFRLRDAMRQTTLDYIVAVRMLRALTQEQVPPAVADPRNASEAELMPSLLAGDFNADGTLDVGGPTVPYFMSGVSLGGVHTSLTAPLEEYIVAAAPVVAGAGLADIFVRTRLRNMVTPIMHLASGPQLVGCPQEDGSVAISFNDDSDRCSRTERITWKGADGTCLNEAEMVSVVQALVNVPPGAHLRATHLVSGIVHEGEANADGSFSVSVPADVGDPVRLEVFNATGAPVADLEFTSPYEGVAERRNTPEFRRLVQRVANVLEGSDAITVADRVLIDPLPGYPATNTLLMLAAGDRTVNYASGLALARSMGLFGRGDLTDPNAPYRAWTEAAIESGALVDHTVTPAPLDDTYPEGGPGYCTTLQTADGKPGISGLCLANVVGHHEYIAQPKDTDAFPDPEGYDGTYTEYHTNMIVTYFHSLGTRVAEDPCWSDWECVLDRGLDQKWDEPIGVYSK